MTQTTTRARDKATEVATIVAVGLAVASLMITANRNSVDDALVAGKVDEFLGEAGISAPVADVIPELVPKAQLAPVPAVGATCDADGSGPLG